MIYFVDECGFVDTDSWQYRNDNVKFDIGIYCMDTKLGIPNSFV